MKLAHSPRPVLSRAFSLIELLVVIAIIALVVSLVIPAVGSARRSARDADTRSLCASLEQACHQYVLDNRRNPGYFSAREMGAATNGARGFSAMQNVMLDLAGGIVATGAAGGHDVGPDSNGTVRVNPGLIGSGTNSSKAYFAPKGKYFQVQDGVNPDGGNRNSDNPDNKAIPELVDAEGTPILIWTIDETCVKALSNDAAGLSLMAQQSSAALARFYQYSNAAFLNTDSSKPVGKRRIPQAEGGDIRGYSLIGEAASTASVANLAALLSSPNAPLPYSATAAVNQIFPSAPRGQFIIHAAGRDGVYFNAKDKGGMYADNGFIRYGSNFKPVAEDVLKSFDDIVIAGN